MRRSKDNYSNDAGRNNAVVEIYQCPNCKDYEVDIPRNLMKDRERPHGHQKVIHCPYCDVWTNFSKIGIRVDEYDRPVRRDYSDFEMRTICNDLKRHQMRRLNNSYGSHPKKKIGKRPWDYKTKNNCMIINQ